MNNILIEYINKSVRYVSTSQDLESNKNKYSAEDSPSTQNIKLIKKNENKRFKLRVKTNVNTIYVR